jgi:hypothetical protein
MMGIPVILFWVIIFVAWDDLGWRWGLTCIAIWVALLAGNRFLPLPSYAFAAMLVLYDAILMAIVFKRDTRIW